MMLPFNQITVVIQGVCYPEMVNRAIAGVRECLPGSRIIFSTCGQAAPEELTGYDELIVSEDPGSFTYEDRLREKENNINRQIVNTLAGIRKATTPYVLKLRSDFLLTDHVFLEYFDLYPKAEDAYRVFDHKILNCCYFARNPRSDVPYPFHPSDLAFFGRTEDLLKLFDIPLMTREQAYWNPKDIHPYQYTAEQYILTSCLKKGNHPFDCNYYNDCHAISIEQTERYFASNFIFMDFEQFNLRPHKNSFSIKVHPNVFRSCYTHNEWMRLYKTYVDPGLDVPQCDPERKKIETYYRRHQKYHLLANICALPFRSHSRRRQVRNAIMEFFLNNI